MPDVPNDDNDYAVCRTIMEEFIRSKTFFRRVNEWIYSAWYIIQYSIL